MRGFGLSIARCGRQHSTASVFFSKTLFLFNIINFINLCILSNILLQFTVSKNATFLLKTRMILVIKLLDSYFLKRMRYRSKSRYQNYRNFNFGPPGKKCAICFNLNIKHESFPGQQTCSMSFLFKELKKMMRS